MTRKTAAHASKDTTTTPQRRRTASTTQPGPANPDPDYTVGLRLEHDEQEGNFYITDLIRVRNMESNRIVQGRVDEGGIVLVDY